MDFETLLLKFLAGDTSNLYENISEKTNKLVKGLKTLAEKMSKLYEHTDIITEEGKKLVTLNVDITLHIDEKEADTILVERVRDLLKECKIKLEKEEFMLIVNAVKKDSARKINRYRKEEIRIQKFEAKDIEER